MPFVNAGLNAVADVDVDDHLFQQWRFAAAALGERLHQACPEIVCTVSGDGLVFNYFDLLSMLEESADYDVDCDAESIIGALLR